MPAGPPEPELFQPAPDAAAERSVGRVRVAVEQGVDAAPEGLWYDVPASVGALPLGARVIVPLGRGDRPTPGWVIGLDEDFERAGLDPDRLKRVKSRDAAGLTLPADLVELARWLATYYLCPIGMVLQTMLPASVKRAAGAATETVAALPDPAAASERASDTGDEQADTSPPKLSKLQRAILERVRQRAEAGQTWSELHELAHAAGAKTVGPVKQLASKGLIRLRSRQVVRSPKETADLATPAGEAVDPAAVPAPPTLNADQAAALGEIERCLDAGGFAPCLVHGVTGSGKTELYLRAIEALRDRAAATARSDATPAPAADADPGARTPGVIVLVPEIALTPQTAGRFLARFHDVAVLHSALTAAQRHEQWRRILDGHASVVIGARSAVFAPLPRVGMIIVDEEHDSSYKQDVLPRYHGRDVAVKRAQQCGAVVLLGSATPSLESYYNATPQGDRPRGYRLLRLPRRVRDLPMPPVHLVDLTEERRQRRGVHLISRRLESAIRRTLDAGGQAMLLLNRRGYANYIACPDHRCGWVMLCDHCDATMVYHRMGDLPTGGLVRCHHCHTERLLPSSCPDCGKRVTVFGLGVQRGEEELLRKLEDRLPGRAVLRMDSDVMRTASDYHTALNRFRSGEAKLLLGTQVIAKGLDFPSVRLVGVISGDTALHLPDFRAAERTFQLIAQVAGRSGRGEQGGEVIVQTFNPDDPTILDASRHDYEAFARRELELRAELSLPPVGRMARIVVRDAELTRCESRAALLHEQLRPAAEREGVTLHPPAPCPIGRIAGQFRHQIEVLAPPPAAAARLQRMLTASRNRLGLHADSRTALDIDPVALL